jgi:hypothetical protein
VEGPDWNPESLGSQFLTATRSVIAGMPFIHGVAKGGTIIDLIHHAPQWGGCVRLEMPAPTPEPPSAFPAPTLADEFWINTLKHRKNLMRGYENLVVFGLDFDRRLLFRAWALAETGTDPGPNCFNLFQLKPLNDKVLNLGRMGLLGLPARSREEIVATIIAFRDEMSRLFPEPSELEETVRAMPLDARSGPD